jgi:putative serine protease XkdF
MPFAQFKDMADCIARNKDKRDPAAYCAAIMRAVEGKKVSKRAESEVTWIESQKKVWIPIYKRADLPQNLVFGFASVSITKSTGKKFTDLGGHQMNPVALEQGVYDFMLDFVGEPAGGVHHEGQAVSRLVESFVITPEKLEVMGLEPDALPTSWWTGWKVPPEIHERVVSGELSMFSIEGSADTIHVD